MDAHGSELSECVSVSRRATLKTLRERTDLVAWHFDDPFDIPDFGSAILAVGFVVSDFLLAGEERAGGLNDGAFAGAYALHTRGICGAGCGV
jgi:hypothetical protein